MNKRRRAYKAHREHRRVPIDYASFYADNAVCFEIEPISEVKRRFNALKREHGIPQHMAMKIVKNLKTGTKKYLPIAKESNKRWLRKLKGLSE